jgi:phosphoribosyl 1,2-cyclic phosphodiesterase
MIIRCWGARGSIPVSGKEYITYGGDTTCIEIRTKNNEIIIVDAGSGIRALGNRLLEEGRHDYTMLFTHSHWDHIMGFPFFKPIYFKTTRINMLGCPFAEESVKQMISKVMAPPNFPVNFEDIKAKIAYHEICEDFFQVDSVDITPIPLSHPNQGMGYKFVEDGKAFVFLTDNELGFRHEGGLDYKDYCEFSKGADLLIHDAEYRKSEYKTTKAWGHSLYTDALRLAIEAGVKKIGLFHHNQERSDQGIDAIVSDCKKTVKDNQVSLECFAMHQGMEIEL